MKKIKDSFQPIEHILLFVVSSLLLVSSGCGTIATATGDKKDFGVYSGTKRSVTNGSHTLLDTPFSVVADTLLLPITVPRALSSKPSAPEVKKTTVPSAAKSEEK